MQAAEQSIFNRNKWIYSLSGIGRDMAYSLFATYLLTYIMYTREITPAQFAAIGVILTICRVWDGINDPMMGGIIENTRTRFGKFKPWIFLGAALNAVALVCAFTNGTQGWTFVVTFAIFYLIWDVTFTMNDISYWSMLPALTSDAKQRDSVTSLANLFAGIGAIIATALVPMLTNGSAAIGGNSITAYAVVAVVVAVFFFLCQLGACVGVRERKVDSAPLREKIGPKKMLRIICKNDQVLWVTLVMLLYNLGSALLTAFSVNYVYLEFGYNGFYVTMLVGFYAVASVAINALYPYVAAKMTRAKLLLLALGITVLGYAVFFINGTLFPINLPLLCATLFLVGLGQSLFYMVITICLTNTIEYNEYKTGNRDEAIIFSLRPFMAKMSSALQQVILTLVYLAIGMTTITNRIADLEQQASMRLIEDTAKVEAIGRVLAGADPSMAFQLRLYAAVLPIVLLSAAYVLMRKKYIIDEVKYKELLAEIASRDAEKNAEKNAANA